MPPYLREGDSMLVSEINITALDSLMQQNGFPTSLRYQLRTCRKREVCMIPRHRTSERLSSQAVFTPF